MEEIIQILFRQLKLGSIICPPEPVAGGLLHKLMKVESDQGIYAVKILNPTIMKRNHVMEHLEFSEEVARQATQNGISGIVAMRDVRVVHQVEASHFMVFPWREAKAIPAEEVTINHCRKVGMILGDLHHQAVSFPKSSLEPQMELRMIDWELFETVENDCPVLLGKYREMLENWDAKALAAAPFVRMHQIISHRDLDCKNVIWDKEQNPFVIDWESVGWVNPSVELLEIALSWAGAEILAFNQGRFIGVIHGYIEAEGDIQGDLDALLDYGFRNKLEWLEYNIKRCAGIEAAEESEQTLAKREVHETIAALLYYEALIPELKSLLVHVFESKE